ncbi:IS30 family transposase [Actinomycetota bacterium]
MLRPHPGRAEFARLRAGGLSRSEAAAAVGIHQRTAWDWDRGVRRAKGVRVYPDGRRVDYRDGSVTMGDVTTTPAPSFEALERKLHPRYLTLQERERIADLRVQKKSLRAIGQALARPTSTVKREIDAYADADGRYRAHDAHRAATEARARPRAAKLAQDGPLRDYVVEKLAERWSPEQIHNGLIREHPGDESMRVATETIYQAIYLQARGGLRREVAQALRTGRTARKPHRRRDQRQARFVDPMVMISDRPPEIEDRAVPGHWEGDLIMGKDNASAIATLVERTTRYVMLAHLPGGRHDAATVRDALVETMLTLPQHLRGSLTWDQGAEMARHKTFTIATGAPVYFCNPHSPWERGSNENTNGLLRQYFPKGTDLSLYSRADLEYVAQQLNGRPRKTLDWDKPAERLRDLLLTT